MNHFVKTAVFAAAVLGVTTLPSAAATFVLGNIAAGTDYSKDFGNSNLVKSFTDYYSFSVGADADITVHVTNSFTKKTTDQAIPDLTIGLYEGVVGSGTLIPGDQASATYVSPYSYTAGVADTIGAGSYYIEVSADMGASNPASYGGSVAISVSAVPLPPSLPLFAGGLLAMAGLGYGAKRRAALRSIANAA